MASGQLSKSRRWLAKAKSSIAACWSALTSDFNYSKDYFFGWDYLMIFAGVRLNSDNAKIRRCWNVYRVLCLLPFLTVFSNAVLNIANRRSLKDVSISIQTMIIMAFVFVRLFIIGTLYESLCTVRGYINDRQFGRILENSLSVRGKAFYRIRRIMMAICVLQIGTTVSCVIIDPDSNLMLSWPWTSGNGIGLVLDKLIGFSTIGGFSMMLLGIVTVYMILSGIRTELKIIAESFETVLDRANRRTQQILESTPCSSEQLEREMKRYFWKFVQEEFDDCVKLHQEFHSILAIIRPFLNVTFFVIYYSTAASIACGVFYALYSKTITMLVLHSCYAVGQYLIECFIFTRAVTLLTEMNESIGEQVYNLDWPTQLEFDPEFAEEYRSVRLTILTIIAVSQQPLRLNCFGLFEFTQQKFTELIKMSYDLVAFFRNFV